MLDADLRERLAVYEDLTLRRLQQARQDLEQRGLAAAGNADDRHGLARLDAEIHPVEDPGFALAVAETQVSHFDRDRRPRPIRLGHARLARLGGGQRDIGQALGTNQIEQSAASDANASVQDLQSRTQLAYTSAVGSYEKVTKLQPNNASAWFQVAQTAQQAGDVKTAVTGYKRYLKLNPNSTDAAQIRTLIKELSPKPSG